jgi:hypothetical protein
MGWLGVWLEVRLVLLWPVLLLHLHMVLLLLRNLLLVSSLCKMLHGQPELYPVIKLLPVHAAKLTEPHL